jgi:hypothetical protein
VEEEVVADRSASGTMTGQGSSVSPQVSPHDGAHAAHHGRPVSWVAVTIITIGFVVGGIAMVPSPKWWLFWTGAAIAVVGCIAAAIARTFDNDWY